MSPGSALLEAPTTFDQMAGRLQPGAQLMLPERPLTSPVTFVSRTLAPDGRWFLTFTKEGRGTGSVLRDAQDHVQVLVT